MENCGWFVNGMVTGEDRESNVCTFKKGPGAVLSFREHELVKLGVPSYCLIVSFVPEELYLRLPEARISSHQNQTWMMDGIFMCMGEIFSF